MLTIFLSSFQIPFALLDSHHLNGNHPRPNWRPLRCFFVTLHPQSRPRMRDGWRTGSLWTLGQGGEKLRRLDVSMGMKLLQQCWVKWMAVGWLIMGEWLVVGWLIDVKCFFVSLCIALLFYLWCWCWSCWCWLSVPALCSSSFCCDFSGRSLAEGIRGCWWGSSLLINDDKRGQPWHDMAMAANKTTYP